ncbi:MAG: RimK family alpha-L-glutamate ligase [Archangium gephyra]|uniref:RimK family alpha-L-glutamate ligase n=1 Tax=Archangium gephyra TaxID=48 RepID=A0A2W5TMA6_9BACT|nr:MAG: RimK family alpha-L-glutamate ligase [Archangium gephyra]
MKLVVLSRSRSIPSTRRLLDEAEARDHQVRVLNPTGVSVFLGEKPGLLYRGKRLRMPDLVIPRIASSIASYGLAVVDQFASSGAVVLNSARAIGLSRNPARCLQRLAAAGLRIPKTVMSREVGYLQSMVQDLGGVPVLVKLLAGSERRGVMVCESRQSLEAALEAVLGLGHNIVMQEYVRKAQRDVRVFVVGGQAIAAVSRRPRAGRLSRSLFRAAALEPCDLTESLRHAAETAARLTELEVCAVDLLELAKTGEARPFEINASPALPEMETVTGVNLARAIVLRAEALLKPEPVRGHTDGK